MKKNKRKFIRKIVGSERFFQCESCEHTWWTKEDQFTDDVRCPKCNYPVGWKFSSTSRPIIKTVKIEEPDPWSVS